MKENIMKKRKARLIKKIKEKLENMLIENNMKVNKEILVMSQKLDVLIVDYYKLE